MLHVGDKFKVHWTSNPQLQEGWIYEVKSVRSDCTCSLPSWVTGKPRTPRRAHCHIKAEIIQCPIKRYENDGTVYTFDGIDEETLCDIENPKFLLEIVREAGDQLSLF